MNLYRDVGAVLKTVVVIALVCYVDEALIYGLSGLPEKAALREMKGTFVRHGSDAMIKVAMPQDEVFPHVFTLYPRTAPSGELQPGEPLTLLVSGTGVVVQIEAAVSGVHKSYEEERQRHRRVLNLSMLAGALALLGLAPALMTRQQPT